MGATMLNRNNAAEFRTRLAQVSQDTVGRWGKLNQRGMLAHLQRSFEISLGEIPVPDNSNFFSRTVLRWLIFHVLPWPKGKVKSPNIYTPEPEGDIDEIRGKVLNGMERFLDAAGSQLGAQQSASLLSNVHFTLGTVYLNQEEYGDAIDEFEEALESAPTDAVAYLRLGMAYARDDEAEDAMEALARAVFLNGPDQARDLLEQIYEAANENLTGLDAFVQNQGEEIGR